MATPEASFASPWTATTSGVCDIEADGYALRGIVVNFVGNHSYKLTVGGNDNCSVTSAAASGRNLEENVCIAFTVACTRTVAATYTRTPSSWYNGKPT
jgi:hypothetical protein